MKDRFYHYQEQTTLRNLDKENRRLKEEFQRLQAQADHHKRIQDFHDRLERDFFSADSLEDLIIKLINCLQLRPDIDFVSLCLTEQYLETMLGSQAYGQILPKMGVSTSMGYLTILDEALLNAHLDADPKTMVEKTPRGSRAIFFPDHAEEVRSHIIIPLVLRRQVIGSLNLGSIRSKHYYTSELGPHLLNRLSAKLAIAIDNLLSHRKLAFQKEVLDRDINRAAILQKSLLPRPHDNEHEGLEIAVYFQPCQRLGGDFYDIISLGAQRIAIVVADVAGHGISAALIAAMLKFSLQMDDMENLSPAEVLSRINHKFCQIFRHDDYITLCYALIDTGNLEAVLARAGHPYPVLYRGSSGELQELGPSGTALGMDAEARYEELRIPLTSGDMVFLYTDGLTDALAGMTPGFDFHEFIGSLVENVKAGYPLDRLRTEIQGLLKDRELEDDTSLVVVRVK